MRMADRRLTHGRMNDSLLLVIGRLLTYPVSRGGIENLSCFYGAKDVHGYAA